MKQIERTVQLLKRGWLTALQSAEQGGCMSLSQRVGQLRRSGVEIADKWVVMPSGARIKAYRISKAAK